ncbi:MAG TPA: glycogen/starch synthase [Gemmatimonadaceae bacterium]|jgi:starch synthase
MVSLDESVQQQGEIVAVASTSRDATASRAIPGRHAGANRRPARRAIVHLTAEYHGYARTGGLAEAVAGLANSQARAGERVYTFLPLYASVREVVPRLQLLAPPSRLVVGPLTEDVRFYRDATRTGAPHVIFVDAPACFDRPGLYGDDRGDYPDNHLRFAMFARAALRGIGQFVQRPLLLHAHDWHAALAPVYMRTHPECAPQFADTPAVMSVHNAGYQGHFGADVMADLALAPALWHMERLEWYGRLNLLKGGLVFCNAAVTVSPAHASELRTAEGGFGLHDTFRQLGDRLVGICNGIDVKLWDPASDDQIAANYSREDLTGKAVCKDALQRAFALPRLAHVPLIGMSSRLAAQKGFDIVLRSARLRESELQLIVIGEGDARIRDAVTALVAAHAGRMACSFSFTDRLEHQLMAGADMVLMPSLYEPCGLTQMHASRYGTPVIGRRVGGIGDTVADEDTGFLFDRFDVSSMEAALDRALTRYRDALAWPAMMRRAMARDFGWDRSMTGYANVYRAAVQGAVAAREAAAATHVTSSVEPCQGSVR